MARKFVNRKLINPLEFEPNEIRRGWARGKGPDDYKKYLRNEASNYIHRPAVRDFVFNRDGYKCVYCGSTEHIQVDHIVSVYKNGENSTDNLQTLCRSCNAGKAV